MSSHSDSCFGLVGDGDEIELIEEIEETFGIVIPDDELERIRCLGDLFDAVERQLPSHIGAPCLTARAFRELRADLGDRALSPGTSVAEISGYTGVLQWLRDFRKFGGVPIDWTDPGTFSERATFALGLLVFGVFIAMWLGNPLPAIFAFGLVLLGPVQSQLSPAPALPGSLGDLVHRSMNVNYKRLAQGHRGTSKDTWWTLVAICRSHSGYEGPVDRCTTFFPRSSFW